MIMRERTIFQLDSKPDAPVDVEDEWYVRHMEETRRPQCSAWRAEVPFQAVHAVVLKHPRSIIISSLICEMIFTPLAEILLPYNKHIEIGTIRLRNGKGLADWVTINYPPGLWLEAQRGRYSRHDKCRGCGRLKSTVGWAHPVIVERYLDEGWLFLDSVECFYADARLVEREELRERLPTIRCYPIPIVPEPLDGETLPGDKGWKCVFRKRRAPKPPPHKPEKGIGLWLNPGCRCAALLDDKCQHGRLARALTAGAGCSPAPPPARSAPPEDRSRRSVQLRQGRQADHGRAPSAASRPPDSSASITSSSSSRSNPYPTAILLPPVSAIVTQCSPCGSST